MTTRTVSALVSIFVILPGALLGDAMAGVLCYTRDHERSLRTHRIDPDYGRHLRAEEWAGTVAGALPGAVLLRAYRRRHPDRGANTTEAAT